MIARPARVRMRKRNPWVRARRRLFGWKVRLPLVTAVVLPVLGSYYGVAAVGTAVGGSSPASMGGTVADARKNARRWAGDDQSLSGQ